MFSMKGVIAHDVFWDMFRLAKANSPLSLGQPTDRMFGNRTACAFPLAKRFYADLQAATPLPPDVQAEVETLQRRWAEEHDRHAAPWSM